MRIKALLSTQNGYSIHVFLAFILSFSIQIIYEQNIAFPIWFISIFLEIWYFLRVAINPFSGKPFARQIIVCYILGSVSGCSVISLCKSWNPQIYWIFILSTYHFCEYLFVCVYKDKNAISMSSFLFNPNRYYIFSIVFGFLEYQVELYFFPQIKSISNPAILGIQIIFSSLCFIGLFIRIGAEFGAGRNFDHQIQIRKTSNHTLVTTGFFKYFRHPSYFGWYLFAVSSQIMQINPISSIGYILASHHFFSTRIPIEEETLINMFGMNYIQYARTTPTRIPFVPGLNYYEFEENLENHENHENQGYQEYQKYQENHENHENRQNNHK